MLGADVRPVPAVAYENPLNYNHQAKEYAESLSNAVWTNQFDNVANAQAHYDTTGPEIWEQTQGKLDGFVLTDLKAKVPRFAVSGEYATYTGFSKPGDTSAFTRIDFVFGGSNGKW